MGFAQIEYCLTNRDKVVLDYLDIMFACVGSLFLLMTVVCSYVDFRLKRFRETSEEKDLHYKMPVIGTGGFLFMTRLFNINYLILSFI